MEAILRQLLQSLEKIIQRRKSFQTHQASLSLVHSQNNILETPPTDESKSEKEEVKSISGKFVD